MKIVVEYVLLENFLINLIVLKTVAILTKEKGKLLWLTAFVSACATVVLPLLNLNTIGNLLLQIGLMILSVVVTFKFKTIKKFLRLFACYFLTIFLYGGGCYFAESLFGIESLLIILFVVVSVFLIVKYCNKINSKKHAVETCSYKVEIIQSGKKSEWMAFWDTGNLLFDPVSGQPVTLINFKVFETLFEEIELNDVILKTNKLKNLKFAHFINLNTLSSGGKILVFQVDNLKIEDKCTLEKPFLGLCLNQFNRALGSDIILHNNFLSIKEGA